MRFNKCSPRDGSASSSWMTLGDPSESSTGRGYFRPSLGLRAVRGCGVRPRAATAGTEMTAISAQSRLPSFPRASAGGCCRGRLRRVGGFRGRVTGSWRRFPSVNPSLVIAVVGMIPGSSCAAPHDHNLTRTWISLQVRLAVWPEASPAPDLRATARSRPPRCALLSASGSPQGENSKTKGVGKPRFPTPFIWA